MHEKQIHSSLAETLKPILLQSTAHGIPRATRGPHWFRRVFWILIFLICFGMFIVQSFYLTERYLQYNVNTKLRVIGRQNVTWPSVTVCNLNKINKIPADDDPHISNINSFSMMSAIDVINVDGTCSTKESFKCDICIPIMWRCDGMYDCSNHEDEKNCSEIVKARDDEPKWRCANDDYILKKQKCNHVIDCSDASDESNCTVYQNEDYQSSEWLSVFINGTREDYSDVKHMGTLSREKINKYGVKIDDFIIQCSFDSEPCSYENFVKWQNDIYGNCFTFNHKDKIPVTSTREGSLYGLKLAMYIDLNNYVHLLSQEAGVRVSIHPRNVQPFPEDEGFSVSPGTATFIRIQEKQFKRVPHFRNKCNENKWPETVKIMNNSQYRYTSKACNKFCLAEYTYKKCNCSPSLVLDVASIQMCSYIDPNDRKCLDDVLEDYSRGVLKCDCEVPCEEVKYRTDFSAASWPEVEYLIHFLRMLINETGAEISKKIWNLRLLLIEHEFNEEVMKFVCREVKKEFVKVEIYFDDLSLEDIYEESQLTWNTYISNIGGSLGLWVGLSIISLVEAFEVIFYLAAWFYKMKFIQKTFRSNSTDSDGTHSNGRVKASTDV